jgi:hypothetical protein
MLQDQKEVELILTALGEQLERVTAQTIELLVCGGSALNVLGLIQRATEDVDILAYVKRNEGQEVFFVKAEPLSPELKMAAEKVARDFNLPEHWLNPGPTSAVDLGLPEGLMQRVITKQFGPKLVIDFLGRYDQIHFKLYAAVDQGGKHFDDLLALKPSSQELEDAARWTITQDPSEGFGLVIKDFLNQIGYADVAAKL